MQTERHERVQTEHALRTLSEWGKNPNTDGGENIAFSLSRQGAPSDALLVTGDCTPFTAGGTRGTLHGQPTGDTGAPVAYTDDFSGSTPTVDQLPCAFEFDLNTGTVTLTGTFPGLPATLDFTVEFFKRFDSDAGKNLLFTSATSSDDAGYVLALQLVGA